VRQLITVSVQGDVDGVTKRSHCGRTRWDSVQGRLDLEEIKRGVQRRVHLRVEGVVGRHLVVAWT